MLKTLKCHRISILIVSIPILSAEENRIYDANGNLIVACHDFCPLLLTGHMSAF